MIYTFLAFFACLIALVLNIHKNASKCTCSVPLGTQRNQKSLETCMFSTIGGPGRNGSNGWRSVSMLADKVHRGPGFVSASGGWGAAGGFEKERHVVCKGPKGLHALGVQGGLTGFAAVNDVPVL